MTSDPPEKVFDSFESDEGRTIFAFCESLLARRAGDPSGDGSTPRYGSVVDSPNRLWRTAWLKIAEKP